MKKLKRVLLFALVVVLITGCKKENKEKLLVINVESAVESPDKIKCSDFIESFEYIPLETTDSCLIDKTPTVHVLGENVVVQTNQDCFIFDAKSGKFKRRISKLGRGPGEYRSTMRLVDPVSKTVFFQRNGGEILEYSINNELIRQFKIPTYDPSFESPSFPTVFSIYKDWVLCYFINLLGDEDKLIMALNRQNGQADFVIPNPNVFKKHELNFISTNEACFYTYKNNQYFKENYNDTIYHINDSILLPHIVLSTGKYLFAPEFKWDKSKSAKDYIIPRNIYESNDYLVFRYYQNQKTFVGLVSKNKRKIVVSEEAELINDVDNFVQFSPLQSISDNSWLCTVDAYKIVQWFKENPKKAAQLPPELQKLRNIKETDNPVVMIAKLKE